MDRPVIGISCYVEIARWGAWEKKAALIPYHYVNVVEAAGGSPVLLPPDGAGDPAVAGELVRRIDGLVLAGGADVGPERYGAAPHPATITRPERDAGELALLAAARAVQLPVLGVCRGMQLITVAYGGSLHQHLPELLGYADHRPEPGVLGAHRVSFAAQSRAAAIFGPTAEVNSYHHQAIADPGKLTVTGWADDGVIEAVEDPDARFLLAVQWHPEEQDDPSPFAAMVEAAVTRGE
jgi:putative glutamine amidotransferase